MRALSHVMPVLSHTYFRMAHIVVKVGGYFYIPAVPFYWSFDVNRTDYVGPAELSGPT